MLMSEIDWTLHGLTDEHFKALDDLLPGWQDLTPVEFAQAMEHVTEELKDEHSGLRRMIRELGEPDA